MKKTMTKSAKKNGETVAFGILAIPRDNSRGKSGKNNQNE